MKVCVPLNQNNVNSVSSNIISYSNNNSELRTFCLMYLSYLRVKGHFKVVGKKIIEWLHCSGNPL